MLMDCTILAYFAWKIVLNPGPTWAESCSKPEQACTQSDLLPDDHHQRKRENNRRGIIGSSLPGGKANEHCYQTGLRRLDRSMCSLNGVNEDETVGAPLAHVVRTVYVEYKQITGDGNTCYQNERTKVGFARDKVLLIRLRRADMCQRDAWRFTMWWGTYEMPQEHLHSYMITRILLRKLAFSACSSDGVF